MSHVLKLPRTTVSCAIQSRPRSRRAAWTASGVGEQSRSPASSRIVQWYRSVCGTSSRATSGMYVSVRWVRNASSSVGWTRSSEWQWLSTIGIADRSSGIGLASVWSAAARCLGNGSVLEEVVRELERLVLVGVRGRLRAPDLQVLGRERRAERLHQHLVVLELVEGLAGRLGEAPDPAPRPLAVGEVAGVLVDRLARVELARDPVQRRGHDATEREVRVRGCVGRLELQVRGPFLVVPVARRDPDRGLAVLDAPGRVGRAPVVGLEPPERVDARRRQAE